MPTITPDDIDFRVYCSKCNAELTGDVDKDYRGNLFVNIEPCEDCLKEREDAIRGEYE